MTTLAIFASGAGSNAEKIMERFQFHPSIRVGLLLCNKAEAGVFTIAEKFGIKAILINRKDFFEGDACIGILGQENIDFIVLAGFLWKIPEPLVQAYPGKIINIHPALLPKYGGKGMYGMRVHQAVKEAGEMESGITIHYVNEHYDEGAIILQEKIAIVSDDTPEEIAKKVQQLEHRFLPITIHKLLQ